MVELQIFHVLPRHLGVEPLHVRRVCRHRLKLGALQKGFVQSLLCVECKAALLSDFLSRLF